jgi:arsenite/tail-anchored protein-transporting ATPase
MCYVWYTTPYMIHTLVFTGNAGPGIALAASATALVSARQGIPTLLLSLGSANGLAALLGVELNSAPTAVAPALDVLAIDPLAELAAAWERGRGRVPSQLAQVAGDELPLPLGGDLLLGLARLAELAPRYRRVVLDAGPHDQVLRLLALPDALRWGVRLLFGLDRDPGRSSASVARAALPTSFLPAGALDGAQNLRVEAERSRERLFGPDVAAARYVLRPDRSALAEARLAIPALQLHGLAVPAIAAGPLLPDTRYATNQEAVATDAGETWPARTGLVFALPQQEGDIAALEAIGETIGPWPYDAANPIAETWGGEPALAIELPGMPKGALRLTLSGDELIVRVGPYRRHILLPEGLRGTSAIRATREGERLIVRRRNS